MLWPGRNIPPGGDDNNGYPPTPTAEQNQTCKQQRDVMMNKKIRKVKRVKKKKEGPKFKRRVIYDQGEEPNEFMRPHWCSGCEV